MDLNRKDREQIPINEEGGNKSCIEVLWKAYIWVT